MKHFQNAFKSQNKGILYAYTINDKLNQQGRSMIEILGVLAIIGVLSIGGIQGYTYAMNKYKANELLNEASNRATIIAGQIMTGNTPSLSEFTTKNFGYAIFEDKVFGENKTSQWDVMKDKKFAFQIKKVSEGVCKNMQNSAIDTIQSFDPVECTDDVTIILTYNNDLSTGIINDTPSDTPSGPDCSAYFGTSPDNTGGYAGLAEDGMTLCNCPAHAKWNVDDSICENLGSDKCTNYTTQECEEGYYCSFDNSASCNSCSDTGGGTCTEGVGTCTALTDGTRVTTSADGFEGLLTSQKMNWWSAQSWCIAHGMQIPSLTEFECFPDDTKVSGWNCDWSRFKGRLSANWWVSNDPDCRARNLAANGNRVDFDTPKKERYYSTLCTEGGIQYRELADVGEACTNSSDCIKGLFCNEAKVCQEKLEDGEVCSLSEACKSGHCGENGSTSTVCFTSCTSYTTNECEPGYYCVFNYPYDCSDSGTGACMPIINGTTLTASEDGIDGYLITKKMNWWTASSLCVAHNMHLASLSEMGCTRGNSCVDCCEDKTRFYNGKLNKNGAVSWWTADHNNCVAYNLTLNGGTRVDFDTQRTNKTYYSVVCK